MFNLFRKSIARDNNSVKNVVNNALGINKVTNPSNEITQANKECSHFFIRYPPLIGKIKTCIRCGIL